MIFLPGPPRDRRTLPERFRFGAIEVDVAGVRVWRTGEAVAVEPKAFDLLLLLTANPGRVVSKEGIFGRLWPDAAVADNALTRVVAHLRRDLGDAAAEARHIETVRTRGYRFLPEIEAVEPAAGKSAVPGIVVGPVARPGRAIHCEATRLPRGRVTGGARRS